MIIPVRCFTCNRVLAASKYAKYKEIMYMKLIMKILLVVI